MSTKIYLREGFKNIEKLMENSIKVGGWGKHRTNFQILNSQIKILHSHTWSWSYKDLVLNLKIFACFTQIKNKLELSSATLSNR